MSLPSFLLFEVRYAFKSCARPSIVSSLRALSTSRTRYGPPNSKQSTKPVHDPAETSTTSTSSKTAVQNTPSDSKINHEPRSRELVPSDRSRRAIDTGRKVNVPIKVVPKAELTPNVRITPKERLHLEMLTRRAPPKTVTPTYKERLLIYHFGQGREKAVILLKFAGIFFACITTSIITPAYYLAGHSPWLCAAIFAAGFIPILSTHFLTGPWISRIFLHLPPNARRSPQAAMEYAHNLPEAASIDVEFLRPVPIAGYVTAFLADFEPASSKFRPTTFRWKSHRADPGTWFRPNPVEFWVGPESSKGKAKYITIPGIWPSVYKRLTGRETTSVSRWKV